MCARPALILDAGTGPGMAPGKLLSVVGVDPRHADQGCRAAVGVAVMLREMHGQPGARDLHGDQQSRREAMLPIQTGAEEVRGELPRLGEIDDGQDRDRLLKSDIICRLLRRRGDRAAVDRGGQQIPVRDAELFRDDFGRG